MREDEATTEGTLAVRYLVQKLQEAHENPALGPTVQALLQSQLAGPSHRPGKEPMVEEAKEPMVVESKEEEREKSPSKEISQKRRSSPLSCSPKRRRSVSSSNSSSKSGRSARGRFHRSRSHKSPSPPPRREAKVTGHARRHGPSPPPRRDARPSARQRRRSHSPSKSSETHDPERRRRRSPSQHARRRRTPSPSDSPSSDGEDSTASSGSSKSRHTHKSRRKHPAWKRSRKMKPKFREGGKNVVFLTYDGTYGETERILAFIQQFDAAFGGEDFEEASKLRHVAMYLTKSSRQWWASLKTRGKAP